MVPVGAVNNDSTVSFEEQSTVVAMVACSQVDSVHVLTKDSAVTSAQLCIGSVCSAVALCGGQALSSFDALPSMAVVAASWWMLLMADL